MKVLVTGGAGFIGSHTVETLLERDTDVAVLDNLSTGKKENLNLSYVQLYNADVNHLDSVRQVVSEFEPDYIIHLAAQVNVTVSIDHPIHDAQSNIIGTLNVLDAARVANVKKVVFASSAAVYGNPEQLPLDESHPVQPLSPYGLSKLTAEHYLDLYAQTYGVDYTILRYSNVYGPRQDALGEGGVAAIFNHLIKEQHPIEIHGDGEQSRDFIYVKDLAEANCLALTAATNNVLNISSNESTTVNELVEVFKKAHGNVEVIVQHTAERKGDIKHSILANQKAKQALQWQPEYSIHEGIQQLIHQS
ncbi:GDP-mannose 4,6-dehydratase [Pontibacillus halophilus]|uniref:GDP-mannose 4,6-dehydratase n=1 Tax=Pontibacillus halophilus TaxID=516704 RepID=UPI00041E4F61|nr:GDP-mannose 4,6-dehydratase [Pontibacillus halophilus]